MYEMMAGQVSGNNSIDHVSGVRIKAETVNIRDI